jgi:trigger factor
MVAGETRELKLRFPEEYHAEDLRGAEVVFDVTLNSVAGKELPELGEEFFARFGVSEGGLDGFRAEVRANMERELKQALRNKVKARVMNALHERTDVEIPQALVRQEIETLRRQALRPVRRRRGTIRCQYPARRDVPRAGRASRGAWFASGRSDTSRGPQGRSGARTRSVVEEMASTYEEPEEVINWYYGNREQLASVEAVVLEDQGDRFHPRARDGH